MKKILLVLSYRNFKDEEFFQTAKILVENGFEIVVASDKKGVALGSDGGEVPVNIGVEEVVPEDYAGIYLIGGGGVLKHLDKEKVYSLVRRAKRGVGAICLAPVVLAHSGILKGKRTTIWSSDLDKSFVREVEKASAEYVAKDVVVDGKIITANGPHAAREFAEKIVDFLKLKD